MMCRCQLGKSMTNNTVVIVAALPFVGDFVRGLTFVFRYRTPDNIHLHLLCPRQVGGGIKRWCCLTSDVYLSVSLSVAYIGPKSRTERPRKTRIGAEVAHVIRDSDTTFKVKRSKVKVTGDGSILCRHAHILFRSQLQ